MQISSIIKSNGIGGKILAKNKNNLDYRIQKFPWKIVLIYFLACFCLYLFGPWEYLYSVDWRTFTVVGLFCILSYFAYNQGVHSFFKNNTLEKQKRDYSISRGALSITIVISFVSTCLMLLLKIGENGLPGFGNIFAVMAQSYSITRTAELHIDLSMRIFYRTAPFIYFSIAVGLTEFRRLRRSIKIITILNIILLVMYAVFYSGQQKQLGDIVIIFISVFMIKHKPVAFNEINKKKFTIIIFAIAIVAFFSTILSARLVMMGANVGNASTLHYNLDQNSIILKVLPDEAALGLAYFIFYISNGFYGLNLCVQQPFIWTKGLGSCSVIDTILEQFFRIDSGHILTYPYRVEAVTSWSATSVWHTIFPWLASDFTFIGGIIILSIGAYIYGKCWCEIKYQNRWQSIFLFSVLNIQWFYMVANNQIFTAKSTFFVFIIAMLLWLTRNWKIKFRLGLNSSSKIQEE